MTYFIISIARRTYSHLKTRFDGKKSPEVLRQMVLETILGYFTILGAVPTNHANGLLSDLTPESCRVWSLSARRD